MSVTSVVSISLPREQIPAVDEVAAQQRRSRSSLISIAVDEYLARIRVAGEQRLAEMERLAQEGLARANRPDPDGSRAAAAAHLAEHRRLSGYPPASDETPGGEKP